jgi:hypothetical protein
VELLATLVVAGFGVGVAVDDVDRPLGVLQLHLLLLIAFTGNLLLVFPLAGRHVVTAWLLLLLLTKLFRELLDVRTLLGAVVSVVVHLAPRPALIAAGGLARPLVTAWVVAPTGQCSNNNGGGSNCHRLIVVVGLLLVVVLAAALRAVSALGLPAFPASGVG